MHWVYCILTAVPVLSSGSLCTYSRVGAAIGAPAAVWRGVARRIAGASLEPAGAWGLGGLRGGGPCG